MEYLKQAEFKSDYQEVEKVEPFLNDLQNRLGFSNELYARMMLSVSEAVTNGIVHGNQLQLEKRVYLKAHKNSSHLYFECIDEGPGYDPGNVADPLEEENLLKPSGRGVFLMKEYSDEMTYNKELRKLTLGFELGS